MRSASCVASRATSRRPSSRARVDCRSSAKATSRGIPETRARRTHSFSSSRARSSSPTVQVPPCRRAGSETPRGQPHARPRRPPPCRGRGDPIHAPVKSCVVSFPGSSARVPAVVLRLPLLLPPPVHNPGPCTGARHVVHALHRPETIPARFLSRVTGTGAGLLTKPVPQCVRGGIGTSGA